MVFMRVSFVLAVPSRNAGPDDRAVHRRRQYLVRPVDAIVRGS
jgi:hypothetical protein